MVAKRTILLAVSATLLSAATIVSASAQPNPSNSTSSINGDWLPGQRPYYHHATRYRHYHGLYMNDLPYYRYSRGQAGTQYKISKIKLSISMIAVTPATASTNASLASW